VIYLIVKMSVYLLGALALGAAGGWLWRNVQAAAREQTLERQLLDARGRLPPLESMLRTCEERLGGLRGELRSRDETLSLRNREIEGLEQVVAELRQQLADADRRVAAAMDARTPAAPEAARVDGAAGGAIVAEQVARIESLESALRGANGELERARAELAEERRVMASLKRERELQHAALQALEQRLEMMRDEPEQDDDSRQAVNG
jgi:chromosome segregation ATPase